VVTTLSVTVLYLMFRRGNVGVRQLASVAWLYGLFAAAIVVLG
jgi:hypothetical protein